MTLTRIGRVARLYWRSAQGSYAREGFDSAVRRKSDLHTPCSIEQKLSQTGQLYENTQSAAAPI